MPPYRPTEPPSAGRARLWTLLGAFWLLLAAAACDSTPGTPENAVIDYLEAAQTDDRDAPEQLCESLREDPDPEELATLDRVVNEASVFGRGLRGESDDSAIVMIEVLFAPSPPGATGDPWLAHVVKEDGDWKLCGVEPDTP